MAWPTTDSLPDSVKAAGYSPKCLEAFREAANNALSSKIGGPSTEADAMKIGHAAAKMCQGSATMNARIRAGR